MALVPIRITRTSKPPLGTPIDWSNPLSQGLVGAWAFNEWCGSVAFDSCNKFHATLRNSPIWSPEGIQFSHGANNTTQPYLDCGSGLLNGATHIRVRIGCYAGPTGAVSEDVNLWAQAGDSSTLAELAVGYAYDNNRLRVVYNNISLVNNAAYVISPNKYHVIDAVFIPGLSVTIYDNGKLLYSTAIGALPNVSGVFTIGAYKRLAANNYYGFNGTITDCQLYRDVLPEIAYLSANPWQIYEPEVMWVSVGGGVASFTGVYAASQLVQTQSSAALLQFAGSTAQIQTANSESLAAILGFAGTVSQTQAQQAQAIYQSLLAITGTVSQLQAAQIASLTASLAFGGVSAQVQAAQTEALAAVLSFAGATVQNQQKQSETLAALLSFGGNISQSQAIQIEALQAILAFSGSVDQTQSQQREIILEFIAAIILNFGFVLPAETKGYVLPMETKGFTLPAETKGYTL